MSKTKPDKRREHFKLPTNPYGVSGQHGVPLQTFSLLQHNLTVMLGQKSLPPPDPKERSAHPNSRSRFRLRDATTAAKQQYIFLEWICRIFS
jgi:hypothetical protein